MRRFTAKLFVLFAVCAYMAQWTAATTFGDSELVNRHLAAYAPVNYGHDHHEHAPDNHEHAHSHAHEHRHSPDGPLHTHTHTDIPGLSALNIAFLNVPAILIARTSDHIQSFGFGSDDRPASLSLQGIFRPPISAIV